MMDSDGDWSGQSIKCLVYFFCSVGFDLGFVLIIYGDCV